MRTIRLSIAFLTLMTIFLIGCKKDNGNNPCHTSDLSERCKSRLDSLCSKSFMGRKTGSEFDLKAFSYLCKTISELGYDFEVQEFDSKGAQCKLRNIIVIVPGSIDSLIIIGSHYDGALLSQETIHYPAANDNASGVVTNLAILDTLKNSNITIVPTLVCAFWDGEEVFDGTWAQGSKYFVNNWQDKQLIWYYINLDSVGHDHVLYVKHMGHGRVNQVLSQVLSNKRLEYVPIDMNPTGGGSSDYVPFGNARIPYIAFGDHNGDMCSYRSHSPNDKVDAISIDRIIVHVKNIIDLIQN